MRKSSKVVSLILAGLMTASCFSVATVSAANVASEATGVNTAQQRIAAGHQLVFFEFPKAWGDFANVKFTEKSGKTNVFCSFYAVCNNESKVVTRSWEASTTACLTDDPTSGIYYFDITESGQGKVEPNGEYGILFSTKANAGQKNLFAPNTDGFQTCDIYFNPDCVGDTIVLDYPDAVVTSGDNSKMNAKDKENYALSTRENTANSQKIDFKAHWKNHPQYGSMKKVSTYCLLIDGMFVPSQPHAMPIAQALQSYLPNPINSSSFGVVGGVNRVAKICEDFETTPEEVRDFYADYYADKLQEREYTEEDPDADAAHPKSIKIYKYEHQDGVDDLKSDGTLKDEYRKYVEETTSWTYKKKVWTPSVASVSYPTLDLVCERLGVDMPGEEETTVEETTVEETTVEETTEEETTVEETTVEETTEEETTVEETTVEETTVEETTVEETTVEETTVEETTVEETTVEETTEEPVAEDKVIVAGGTAEIFGTSWDGINESNLMTKTGDVYTKTYTVDKAYSAVQLKSVVNNKDWIGGEDGENVTFDLTGAGEFTVTYDPTAGGKDGKGVVTVSGDIVKFVTEFKYDTVYAVGNGDENWLNGVDWKPNNEANKMTKVADNLWEITFEEVAEGTERQIKFAIDGAWIHNFGMSKEEGATVTLGEPNVAAYDGNNIKFDNEETSNIKAQLDLRNFDFATKTGATFTLTITPCETEETTVEETTVEDTTASQAEEVGIIGEVDGDGEVTINDATEIQRAAIELVKFNETQTKLADTNGDGRVSILDVTAIQAYLARVYEAAYNTNAKLLADGTIIPANN